MSDDHKEREALKLMEGSACFAGLDSHQRLRVLRVMRERKFDPGQDIYEAGSYGAGLYMVTEGAVELISEGSKDVRTLGKAEVFGASALIRHAPREHTARAKSFCRLLVLYLPELFSLGMLEPALVERLKGSIEKSQ